jgi:ankyrin repeat protein
MQLDLQSAIRAHNVDRVVTLLREGADANSNWIADDKSNLISRLLRRVSHKVDDDSLVRQPVTYVSAVYTNNPDFNDVELETKCISVLAALLDRGADPNCRSREGTPLILETHDWRVVRLLLDHGANPKVDDSALLNRAVRVRNLQWINTLLSMGADANNHVGPLVIAVASGNVAAVKTLIDHGASVTAKYDIGGSRSPVSAMESAKSLRSTKPKVFGQMLQALSHAPVK